LRQVWDEAVRTAGGRVSDVMIAVPSSLREHGAALASAAVRAGMPRPALVDSVEAVASQAVAAGVGVPDGDLMAVVRLDGAADEVSIVYRDGAAFHRLVSVDLSTDNETLEQAADRLGGGLVRALREAGLTGRPLAAVVGQVRAASRSRLASALRGALGDTTTTWWADEFAEARGGLLMLDAAGSRSRRLRRRHRVYFGAVAGVGLAGAVALMVLLVPPSGVFDTPWLYLFGGERPDEAPMRVTDRAALAVVTVLFAVATFAVGRWAATVHRRKDAAALPAPDSPQWAAQLRGDVAFAGFCGFLLAAAHAAAVAGKPRFPGFLSDWTLWFGVALMIVLAGLGVLVPYTRGRVDWQQRLRFPLDALVFATAGILLLYVPTTTAGGGAVPDWLWNVAGGAGVGAAVALLFVGGRIRVVASLVLAAVGGMFGAVLTPAAFDVLVAAAFVAWWLVRAGLAGRLALATWRDTGPHFIRARQVAKP
jgi:hypothetical protein